MRLSPVDDLLAFPPVPSVSELMAPRVARGRCEVLPAVASRASAWAPGAIGPAGGRPIPPWWDEDPVVPCRDVSLFRIRDAFLVPAYGVVFSAAGDVSRVTMEEAAFTTPDLSALPGVRTEGGAALFDPARTRVGTIERAAVTMPWGGTKNYGHFVLDCLTGASLVRSLPELDSYPAVFPPLRPWQRRHLELAEVAAREVDDPVLHVSDLVTTSCMAHFLASPNVAYRTLRERQIGNHAPTRPGAARVLVSRAGRSNRRFLSEEALAERLEALGFTRVVPEERSVDDQIRLFREAEVVVGCTGAALANALYCSPGTAVVEIKSSLPKGRWLGWLSALLGLRWRPWFCEDVAAEGARPGALAFDTDVDALARFVEAQAPRPLP